MAWIDDRVWCHPKLTDLSDKAFRTHICGIAYSAGFGTKGFLSREQQKLVGGVAGTRRELVEAGLWDEQPDGLVYIHDWDEHNSKRDERREKDKERKRAARASGRWNEADRSYGLGRAPSAGQSTAPSAAPARVDRVTGSEGSEELQNHRPVGESLGTVHSLAALQAAQRLFDAIPETDRDEGTQRIVLAASRELPAPVFDEIRVALEAKLADDGLFKSAGAYVNGALQKALRGAA